MTLAHAPASGQTAAFGFGQPLWPNLNVSRRSICFLSFRRARPGVLWWIRTVCICLQIRRASDMSLSSNHCVRVGFLSPPVSPQLTPRPKLTQFVSIQCMITISESLGPLRAGRLSVDLRHRGSSVSPPRRTRSQRAVGYDELVPAEYFASYLGTIRKYKCYYEYELKDFRVYHERFSTSVP